MKRVIVPGTFDPITSGHLDVITRAAQMADEVIVAVAASIRKNPLFSLEQRVELAAEACKNIPHVRVLPFTGLLVNFAREHDAKVVIKGLRATTDFEYEFQQTALNYQLDPGLEAVFLMSPPEYMYLSSSIVREIASMHGPLESLVPENVRGALEKVFAE